MTDTADLVERLVVLREGLDAPDSMPLFEGFSLTNGDLSEAATLISSSAGEVERLRGLIRECRLADGYAARTGEELRWDRAFHALCEAERQSGQALAQQDKG